MTCARAQAGSTRPLSAAALADTTVTVEQFLEFYSGYIEQVDEAAQFLFCTASKTGIHARMSSAYIINTRLCVMMQSVCCKRRGLYGVAGVVAEDVGRVVGYVVETHPGLAFLSSTLEFQARYIETVIARIFYTVNRSE
jgi:hypothetical protein